MLPQSSRDPDFSSDREKTLIDHSKFISLLANTKDLLIIQDLDGVCMGLVKDPLHRQITRAYVEAVPAFNGHFFVLTNGEHVGKRGVNTIVDRALGNEQDQNNLNLYLPGLAAGGVQWQDRYGNLSHPGVSEYELAFLKDVPRKMAQSMREFLAQTEHNLPPNVADLCLTSSVLDNVASPTANLNTFHEKLSDPKLYLQLQERIKACTDRLLSEAHEQGLSDSFFVHYAPNLGRDNSGSEIVWWADETTSGTTDFQFMLKGAIKEAGVLALLNRYYFQKVGQYPLGEDFSARKSPGTMKAMLSLVQENFDSAHMPIIVGVGDTVTSQGIETEDGLVFKRGGSDRNFLRLIQEIGQIFGIPNLVVYVDSSGGELKNRRPVLIEEINGISTLLQGPGDPSDASDPLTLNVVFSGGHSQYCQAFQTAAQQRM